MTLTVRLLRFFLRILVNCLYDIQVIGAENVPKTGGCLLASNHLSYADPFIFAAACPRVIRFLAWRELFKIKAFAWFSHQMRSIPISDDDSRRQLVASLHLGSMALENGECLGLFAEGSISRIAQVMGFRKGLEHMVKGPRAPIIPVHIDGVWGSVLSYEGRKFFWKWPRITRIPVTVSFGKSLPAGTPATRVREAVLELATNAFRLRLKNQKDAGVGLAAIALQEALALTSSDIVQLAPSNEFGPSVPLWIKRAKATTELTPTLDAHTLIVKGRFALTTKTMTAALTVPVFRIYVRPELFGIALANVPNVQKGTSFQIGTKMGSVGRPLPGVAARIENGFLYIKGPTTDWIATQQRAEIDAEGFVTLM